MSALAIGVPIILAIIFFAYSVRFLAEMVAWGISEWWEGIVTVILLLVYAYVIGWIILP